jgi:hypothetical protein
VGVLDHGVQGIAVLQNGSKYAHTTERRVREEVSSSADNVREELLTLWCWLSVETAGKMELQMTSRAMWYEKYEVRTGCGRKCTDMSFAVVVGVHI